MAGETCAEHGLPVAMCEACAPRREATVEEMTAHLKATIAQHLAAPPTEWFADPGVGAPLAPFLRNTEETRAQLMYAARQTLEGAVAKGLLLPEPQIEFTQLPPSPEDKANRILPAMQFTARLGGVIARYPASVAYMDSFDVERDIAYDAREEGRYPTLAEIDRPRRRRETHPITGLRADRLIVDDPYEPGDDRVDAALYVYNHFRRDGQ